MIVMDSLHKLRPKCLLLDAFPKSMKEDVKSVLQRTMLQSREIFLWDISRCKEQYVLSDSKVDLPGRCDLICKYPFAFQMMTPVQKNIFACIGLLNHNGYSREKYLRHLLQQPLEEWMLPFLMQVSGGYVKEILAVMYEYRKEEDNTLLREFCERNLTQTRRNYSRMTSYWNEYYRYDVVRPCVRDGRKGVRGDIRDYVGYHLFRQCWGVSPRRLFDKSSPQ